MGTCASGASVASGFNADTRVIVNLAAWNQIMGVTSNWFDWIVELFVPKLVRIGDICALNPDEPADPSLLDIVAAFNKDPFAIDRILAWWEAKLTYAQFSRFCVCNTPPPFSCVTSRSHPDNAGWSGGAAQDYAFGVEFVPSADVWCYGGWLRVSTVGAGTAQHGLIESGGANLSYLESVTPTTSDDTYFFATPQFLLAGHTYKYFYQFPNAGWSQSQKGLSYTPVTNAYATFTQCVYKNPISASWNPHTTVTDGTDPLFCPAAGSPPLPVPPVQPTDLPTPSSPSCSTVGDLCGLIMQIMQRLDWMWRDITILQRRVDLIQRQGVPFGYIVGAVHAGLTGSGQFAVSDILGLLVQVSTIPVAWGLSSDNPQRYIPAPAMVAVGTLAGDQDTHFVHFTEELVFPDAMGAMTLVKYEFKPGVHGAITELLREP